MTRPPEERFRAAIRRIGSSAYVAVPPRVSRALQDLALDGRIFIEGTIEEASFRATLVPVAGGGHRLFVNGGMRAAAGVNVGDAARFVVRGLRGPEEARVPRDVASGLGTAGARAAFAALPASRRRELLRYIDDARTPEGRRRRIERTADHVLGRPAIPAKPAGAKERPLWTCPRCGHAFVNKNQYHSCRRHTLAEAFAGKPPRVRRLFERFRTMVESCGPVAIVPYRDRVGFMARVRFAGATPRKAWLDVGFWLPRRIDHPRLRRVETIGPRVHVHSLRVTRPEDLDAELQAWLREAYAVGRQEHLG